MLEPFSDVLNSGKNTNYLVFGMGEVPILKGEKNMDTGISTPDRYVMPGGTHIEDYDAAVRVAKYIDKMMRTKY